MSYARTAVTRMTLDMSRLDLQRSETVTLGDTNRRWEVTLINGGTPFRLPNDWSVALSGIKPDGTGLFNGCSVVDGRIVYDFAPGAGEEIATCVGGFAVQFDVWDEVGALVASPKLWVNVLADVRPREQLASDDQFTKVGELIGLVNEANEDIAANASEISVLKKNITALGSIIIHPTDWTDTTPYTALLPILGAKANSLTLFYPLDDATRLAAGAAKLSMQIDSTMEGATTYVVILRTEEGERPEADLHFGYAILRGDGDTDGPGVAMIGVDAYGGGGGGNADGVDEEAVTALIRELVPAWAREEEPPEDAVKSVNGQTGDVKLTIPEVSKSAVGLGNVANERQYSAANPPPYPVTSVNGLKGAVVLTATLLNAYTKNEVDTLDATLRDMIQTVTDRLNVLANSDDTTLDDLKEVVAYIKSNRSLIDSITASKVSVEDIIDNLVTDEPAKPLSAAQGVALKRLIDDLADVVEGKQTAEQVEATMINYLVVYAKKSDIPTTLPNPHAITILGKTYTGAAAVNISIDDILAALPASEEVAV